jgi:hypothetical protein
MKALSFVVGGKVVLAADSPGAKQADLAATKVSAELTKLGIFVCAEKRGVFGNVKEKMFVEFPLRGSSFAVLDSGSDMTRSALGAVAGGILLGPVGLVAGGLVGASKKHLYEVRRGEDILLLELTPSEKTGLLGLGFLREGNVEAPAISDGPLPDLDPNAEATSDRYCVTCQSIQPAAFPPVPMEYGVLGAGAIVSAVFLYLAFSKQDFTWLLGILAVALGSWGLTKLSQSSKRRQMRSGPAFCRRCSARC